MLFEVLELGLLARVVARFFEQRHDLRLDLTLLVDQFVTLLRYFEFCFLCLFQLLLVLYDGVSDSLDLQLVLLCSLFQLLALQFILASVNLLDQAVKDLDFLTRLSYQGCFSSAFLSSREIQGKDTVVVLVRVRLLSRCQRVLDHAGDSYLRRLILRETHS